MLDQDDIALFSSEIFRNFANQQLQKEAEEQRMAKDIEVQFEELQKKINGSEKLRTEFKKVQNRMKTDKAYREANNEAFVKGIMLLDFGEDK